MRSSTAYGEDVNVRTDFSPCDCAFPLLFCFHVFSFCLKANNWVVHGGYSFLKSTIGHISELFYLSG